MRESWGISFSDCVFFFFLFRSFLFLQTLHTIRKQLYRGYITYKMNVLLGVGRRKLESMSIKICVPSGGRPKSQRIGPEKSEALTLAWPSVWIHTLIYYQILRSWETWKAAINLASIPKRNKMEHMGLTRNMMLGQCTWQVTAEE